MGGCGVFGGRGEYSVIIKVFEDATDSDGAEADGQLVAETDNLPYECGYRYLVTPSTTSISQCYDSFRNS